MVNQIQMEEVLTTKATKWVSKTRKFTFAGTVKNRKAGDATFKIKSGEKYKIIRSTVEKSTCYLKIKHMYEIAGVSRSGYYSWIQREQYRIEKEYYDRQDFELILKGI